MTSRDLVRAAIAHQQTPRVPYCIGYTADGASQLERLIGAGRSADEFTDNDVVRVGPPWWHWHQLGPDWGRPPTPTSRDTVRGGGSYEAFFDQLKRLHDETGKYLLVTIYGSHFEKAYFSRGIENFLADMAGDPPFARQLLRRIVERNLVMLENVLACPEADGVLLGSDWGTQVDLIMSPQTWRDMIRPGEQEEYDLVHSFDLDVWIHSCGNVQRIIPDLIDMGVQVLNPVQPECMDLHYLKQAYGERLTFWGGVSTQQTLPYGTPDEVRAESRRVRDLMSRGGGYVFSPAQEIQGDVPAENIMALIEVARETRREPA